MAIKRRAKAVEVLMSALFVQKIVPIFCCLFCLRECFKYQAIRKIKLFWWSFLKFKWKLVTVTAEKKINAFISFSKFIILGEQLYPQFFTLLFSPALFVCFVYGESLCFYVYFLIQPLKIKPLVITIPSRILISHCFNTYNVNDL